MFGGEHRVGGAGEFLAALGLLGVTVPNFSCFTFQGFRFSAIGSVFHSLGFALRSFTAGNSAGCAQECNTGATGVSKKGRE